MKIKRKYLYAALIVAAILAFAIFYFKTHKEAKKKIGNEPEEKDDIIWLVDKNGYLDYPLNRGEIKFRRANYSETANLSISKVVFQSRGSNIYGLLVLPKNVSEQVPGIVLLPGAGVSKESELKLAEKIAELGAAVLTIDQRGIGETNGIAPSLDDDYVSFLKAEEPHQHLMVYDALRAYDLLYSAPFVDPGRIIIAGESLGGRIAVIAAAIDRNIKGVLVISSSGFDFKGGPDANKNAFLQSIDSDHYISQITPRKTVMIHNAYDQVISLSSAISTFKKAQEPKQFVLVNDTSCNHGYCGSMYDGLVDALDYLVGIRSKTLVSVPAR